VCGAPREEDAIMRGSRCNRLTRRAAAILLAAILLAVAAAGDRAHAQSATVLLVVDYGDGVIKTITGLPWAKGSTVLDVMNAAKERPHGITFNYTGSGASALLTRIDDVANEGGGAKKNWQLWVNTSYADRSFGVYEVQPLDVVFWRFTTQAGK
jgi:ABC-type glycerol-3-phosphate transport system substrate-binding protein